MAYTAYATAQDYAALFPGETAPGDGALRAASRHIDSMTFDRIPAAGGINALTAFQQELVREAVCRQARFETECADLLDSPLTAYGINGVSMRFGGAGTVAAGGIPTRRDIYGLLRQSGLCCRALEGRP